MSDDFETSPLSCAVTAAEAAAQTVALLWQKMGDEDRAAWLDVAPHVWPRLDTFLSHILRAAEGCVVDENAIKRGELPDDPSST